MKKIMSILVVMLFVLTNSVFAGAQTEATEEKVVLNVFNYGDLTTPEGQAWLTIKDEFLKQNPDIVIEDDSQYDETYHQKLQALLAAGTVPDILYAWQSGDRLQPLLDAGIAIDQRPFINQDDYFANSMTGFGPNGEMWTVPIGVGAHHVIYVNTEILNELGLSIPETYEDLKGQVDTINNAGYTTIAMANADSWVMGTCLFSTFLGRYGGAEWITDVYKGKAKFTGDVAVNALKMVRQLYVDKVLPEESVLTDYGTSLSMFINDEAVYMIDGGWRAGGFDADFASKVGWIAFPAIPGEKYAGSINGGVTPGYAITKPATEDPAKFEAAKKLLSFISGEYAHRVRAETQGVLPSYKISGSIVYKEGTEAQGEFLNNAALVTLTMDNMITGDPVTITNTGLQELGLGTKTAEEVAAEIEAAMMR